MSEWSRSYPYTPELAAAKARFLAEYGQILIETNKPVAFDSPDHLHPRGTKNDNSEHRPFNAKLRTLPIPTPLRVLDLGCAGGGMVRSFLAEGEFAVGVEGSDYSKQEKRAEWGAIPEFLLTADITEPFAIRDGYRSEVLQFSCVTMWEVLEHIRENKLAAVFANIDRHLMPGGVVVASVCTENDWFEGVAIHQTVKPEVWWMATFWNLGWVSRPEFMEHFAGEWVRDGVTAPHSFHVVLGRKSP